MTLDNSVHPGQDGLNLGAIVVGLIGAVTFGFGIYNLARDTPYITRSDNPAIVREDTTHRYHGLHPGLDLAITATGGIAAFGGIYNCADGAQDD